MGEVYRAHDSRLRRDIALKILPPEAADADRRQRFAREAQAVAALNHPGIVTIHSVEESGPSTGSGQAAIHFLTMELVDGKTLDLLIPSGGLAIDRLLALAVPLADAVGAAHSRGIVHRDLKPTNVMVTKEGRVKVMDFGLAKLTRGQTLLDAKDESVTNTAQLTEDGRIFGTVAYMSPEQAEGREVDHRSDVFSLGILLFEMATGRRPFTGDSAVSVLASIVKDSPPRLTDLKPGLPAEFSRLVRKCLAKDPVRRYQSVLDVRNDLEEIGEDLASPQATPRRSSHRRRWLLPVAASAGALIAIAVVVVFLPSAKRLFWPAPPDKSKFGIMIFHNDTNNPLLDPIGRQISGQIAAGLNGLDGVSTTPIENSSVSVDAARHVVEGTGVGRVVGGNYFLNGDDIRVEVNVREVGTGEETYPFLPIDVPLAEPASVVAKVVSYLKGAVAYDKFFYWNGQAGRSRPVPYEAWVECERALTTNSDEEAIPYFRRARNLAPDAFFPKLMLFNRYVRLGHVQEADAIMEEIDEIYAKQTLVSQAVTRRYREVAKGHLRNVLNESAVLARLEKYEFNPLGILAEAQTQMRYLDAAEETYRRQLALPIQQVSNDSFRRKSMTSRLVLASIDHEFESFDKQLDDAKRGENDFPEVSDFFFFEASALIGQNKPLSDIQEVIRRARLVARNQTEMAEMLTGLADELRAHGHGGDAISLSNQAIQEIRKEIGGTDTPAHRAALMRATDWRSAYSAFSAVVKADPNDFVAQANVGVVAAFLGKKAQAREIADSLQKVNVPYIRGQQHYQRARVLAALGDADLAVVALKRSFEKGYGWVPGAIHRDIAFDKIRGNAEFKEFCAPKNSGVTTSGGGK
jgi:serine/threonine protein kinase/tetratricopeptide (TPR) repeat protein